MAEDKHNHSESKSTTEINIETTSEQIAETREEVSELDTKVAELTQDLMMVQAEFMNFRRRTESERAELTSYAKGQVIRELLSVRDNLDRAMAHQPAELEGNPWVQSFNAIAADFDAILARLGAKRFASVGEAFDPHRHEAIATEGDGSTVTEELQPGYLLGEAVLRHAVVKVGDAPTT